MFHPIYFLKLEGTHISDFKSDVYLLVSQGGMSEAVVLNDHVLNCALQFDTQGHMWGRIHNLKVWIMPTSMIHYYPLIYFQKGSEWF